MQDPDVRALVDKTVIVKWEGKDFKISPKPLTELDRLAEEMDKLLEQGADVGKKGFFVTLFRKKREDAVARLRFFVSMPPDVTDEWLLAHLTIPQLAKFEEIVAEVNQLEYIANFFGPPGLMKAITNPEKEKTPPPGVR